MKTNNVNYKRWWFNRYFHFIQTKFTTSQMASSSSSPATAATIDELFDSPRSPSPPPPPPISPKVGENVIVEDKEEKEK
jgi:hypothetical protein